MNIRHSSRLLFQLAAVSLLVPCALHAAEPEKGAEAQPTQPRPVKQLVEVVAVGNAGQVVVSRPVVGPSWPVREDVDRDNPHERFLLLLPDGPVIVAVELTIDGAPYQHRREALIDELLAAADINGDTRIEWDEALQSPRFTLGRVQVGNQQQFQQYRDSFDVNSDGLVDRTEVRRFVATFTQGPAFVSGQSGGAATAWRGGAVFVANNGLVMTNGGAGASVMSLLDADGNGSLSPAEIDAAPDRLTGLDADGNDLLYPAELTPAPEANATGNAGFVRSAVSSPESAQQTILILGPEVPADSILQALRSVYAVTDNGGYAAADDGSTPQRLARFDANGNLVLEAEELVALNSLPADIELTARLGDPQSDAGVTVQRMAENLPAAAAGVDAVRLSFQGVDLQIDSKVPQSATFDYSQTGKQLISQYDKDANGYLEASELPDQLGQQFAGWDDDRDGKVYAEEIVASYNRMFAPQMSQVRANLTKQGDPLFGLLDGSGDGRLSLREMKTAAVRLGQFDVDSNGELSPAEVPETWTLAFGLGNTYAGMYRVQQTAATGSNAPAANGQPEWFVRMDRNGDGDLTLREFLGDRQKFNELDANGDGFIEPAEVAVPTAE